LVMSREIAPSHRPVASAARFIIESSGAYTAVDGERTTMHPRDFIITPSWTYHEHATPSDAPAIWMDGLDMPIVNLFDASLAEPDIADTRPITKPEGDALVRYGANLLPVDDASSRRATPIFNYPYSKSREALEQLFRNGPVHPA